MQRLVQAQELQSQLNNGERIQVIDVRSHGEFSAGHIPRSINVPMEEVESRIQDFRTDEPLVLVCHSGNRAELCFEKLKNYRGDLSILEGGTESWSEIGAETVQITSTTWAIERQVRLGAGALVLLFTVLAVTVSFNWVYLAMLIGAGLTFAGLTNICGMAKLFAIMPLNKPKSSCSNSAAQGA